ncbi:MAG: carbohydrate kinase [Bacilli bacterium]|nr:carbohydrate kinase [Bacilli bacterium]
MRAGTVLLTIDQSTSGTKAVLVDQSGRIAARNWIGHRQIYPKEGWVEHDPLELYENVKRTIREVIRAAGVDFAQIAAITLTNQRETALIWDRVTGCPIANAIVWQCRRTAEECERLKQAGYAEVVFDKTGLLLDPYFSATKWRWILDHCAHSDSDERLLAGTIDSWLLWKLTGGQVHATDFTNASRTLLFNIHSLQWDEELLSLFGIPRYMLPEVRASDQIFGFTDEPDLFPVRIPIAGIIGDSQGALFGQQCMQPGLAKGTYGTGTSVLMNVGSTPIKADNGLVSTVAWGLEGTVSYAIEAIIHTTGDCLKWARDELGLFKTYEELDDLIASITDTGGVSLVPAFVGLGAPHWNPYARAAIVGLNRASNRAHILRAAVESIAFQVWDAVKLLEAQTRVPLGELRVDGGATRNSFLMQFQADLLDTPVICSDTAELSALGSAFMGGLAIGFWRDPIELRKFYRSERTYLPAMDSVQRGQLGKRWESAVNAALTASAFFMRG